MCEKEIECASHPLQCGICWPQGTYDVFQRWGKGGVEVKQARLWEHSNISLSLLCDKTFKGESVRAYEKSQLINLLATVPRHIHRQIKNKNTNWSKCPLTFTNCLTLLCSSYDSQMCLQSKTILQKISSHLPVGHLQWVEARCRVSSISLWPRQYTTRQHSATQIRSSELLSPAKSLLSPARVQHMIVSTQIGACANIVCTPLRILSRLV